MAASRRSIPSTAKRQCAITLAFALCACSAQPPPDSTELGSGVGGGPSSGAPSANAPSSDAPSSDATAPKDTAIYVDPDKGDDAQDGSLLHPVRTIVAAQRYARSRKNAIQGDVYVWLRAGTYALSEPLTFTPEDSGRGGQVVHYKGYPGDPRPIVTGGTVLSGWHVSGFNPKIYWAPTNGAMFRQLYYDSSTRGPDQKATRARWPKHEWWEGASNPAIDGWLDPSMTFSVSATQGGLKYSEGINQSASGIEVWDAASLGNDDDAPQLLLFGGRQLRPGPVRRGPHGIFLPLWRSGG
jgi:hypothetical protein